MVNKKKIILPMVLVLAILSLDGCKVNTGNPQENKRYTAKQSSNVQKVPIEERNDRYYINLLKDSVLPKQTETVDELLRKYSYIPKYAVRNQNGERYVCVYVHCDPTLGAYIFNFLITDLKDTATLALTSAILVNDIDSQQVPIGKDLAQTVFLSMINGK